MTLEELGIYAAALTAIIVLGGYLWRGFKLTIDDIVNNGSLAKYVKYHLGPNGDATPLHKRVEALENKE